MPLNFTEIEKPKEVGEFFTINLKARPLDLEGEVLPELIRRCGDVKSGRITSEMVEKYLDKNVLIFDRGMVRSLFQEADYKKEGSLDARSLKAALLKRYPKRQLIPEWRQLVALILGVPKLELADDRTDPKYFDGALNKDSIWDNPPKELPKVTRRRKPKPKTKPGDWQGTTAALQASGAGNVSPGTANSTGVLRTAEGLKSTAPLTQAEHDINAQGLASACSTFASCAEFERHQKGLLLAAAFEKTAGALSSTAQLTEDCVMNTSTAKTIKSWNAALPPTAITMPNSALTTLRSSVRSTLPRKPEFIASHKPLSSAETDLKKTLGEPLDVSLTLNRVEPVWPTKLLPNADFIAWGDYSSRSCRTAPSNWYNEHPAAPAPGGGLR